MKPAAEPTALHEEEASTAMDASDSADRERLAMHKHVLFNQLTRRLSLSQVLLPPARLLQRVLLWAGL